MTSWKVLFFLSEITIKISYICIFQFVALEKCLQTDSICASIEFEKGDEWCRNDENLFTAELRII